MLRFIYGRAATGKTGYIYDCLCNDVKNGADSVLLVPEQFTFESERTLLHYLGDAASTKIKVLSFTRLFDEVAGKVGGRTADIISEYDKIILMRLAFDSIRGTLKLWSGASGQSKFIETLLCSVSELKTASITPDDLMLVAQQSKDIYFNNKLTDLSAVYSAYNAMLGSTFIDPSDNITVLNDKLLSYRYFSGKKVYIDSFKGFTGQQFKILERIISQAEDVIISLTTDDILDNDVSVFYNVNKTAQKLMKIAKKTGKSFVDPIKFDTRYYSTNEMAAVEEILCNKVRKDFEGITKNVTVCRCATPRDEAVFAIRNIRRLVRENGYRYKDFVIIARNAETYQSMIEKECQKNDVFCFSDKRKPIINMPLIVFVLTAIKLCGSFDTESLLKLHKTGLTKLNADEIYLLENYVYLWNIDGKMWFDEWNMNPRGFVATGKDSADFSQKLNNLNSLRLRAIEPIIELRDKFHGTPKEYSEAIVSLLNVCNTAEKLKQLAHKRESNGYVADADDLRQCWDLLNKILDSIVKCVPNTEIRASDFTEIFEMAVSSATIGNIPQMLDEVTFGSADRIRPSRPKVAFVLGVNQGVFPASATSGGILSAGDRTTLIENGLEIKGIDVSAVIEEDYLGYTAVCCASDRLFLTYCEQNSRGEKLEPSHIITDLTVHMPGISTICEPTDNLCTICLPETVNSAVEQLYLNYNSQNSDYLTYKEALREFNNIDIEKEICGFNKGLSEITSDTSKKLYGKKFNLSATAFDTFHKCHFSFFCKYGLMLKKIQPAEFDVLQRGTLAHYVFEKLISRFSSQFVTWDRQQCDNVVDEIVKEYLSLIDGFDRIVSARLEFLVKVISDSIKDVAYHMVCEFSQSSFTPEFCELGIGDDGIIPAVKLPFGEDGEIHIRGSIDRVDTWNGYVRIVDYKTGSRKFRLPDVLFGLNLQMLIYLYAVIRGENSHLNRFTPAGVLYMPSKRDMGDEKKLSMNGLVLLDEDVIEAMDKEKVGKFIPRSPYKKNGEVSASNSSFIDSEVFDKIFDYIEILYKRMGSDIMAGVADAQPVDGCDSNADACKYCDYRSICCIEKQSHKKADGSLKPQDVLQQLKEADEYGI